MSGAERPERSVPDARSAPGDRGASRERRAPWIEGACLAFVVLAILALGGDTVRASYHGYLHTAVGEAVLRDGLVPENPYHAGTPLRYYTLYPALGVLIGRIGIGPLWAFALLNTLAALLLAPALDALGRAAGLGFVARRAAFLAAVLGFNALGWTGYLFAGETRFGEPPVYALQPACFAGHTFGWDARLQAFLPKFLNVSSFALALPFALWGFAAAFGERGRSTIVAAGASLGLATALNPLAGGVAGACAAVALAPALARGTAAFRLAWCLAALVAGVIALPFLLPAFERAPAGPSLTGTPDLGGSPISNLVGPLLLVLPLGIAGLARLAPRVRWRLAVALALCAVLVLVGEMPQGNEYKMARMGALLWAVPAGALAGAWYARDGRTRVLALLLLVLALPTTLLVPWAYLAYGREVRALPLGGARRDFGVEGSVVVMSHAEPGTRLGPGLVQGNALAPALAHPLFVDLPQIHNEGQPDLELRLDLVAALYGGEDFRPRDGRVRTRAAALAELRSVLPERPLLLFLGEADRDLSAVLSAAGAVECAREGGSVLLRLAPLASMAREDR